ncbi:MAG: hypothetical protein J6W69_04290 [Bacteroidales bacterium]|nr:hypothetical protein [Bacteroidales bacterium]
MKKEYIEPEIVVVEIKTEGLIAISWSEGETTTMDAPQRRGSCWDEYEQR